MTTKFDLKWDDLISPTMDPDDYLKQSGEKIEYNYKTYKPKSEVFQKATIEKRTKEQKALRNERLKHQIAKFFKQGYHHQMIEVFKYDHAHEIIIGNAINLWRFIEEQEVLLELSDEELVSFRTRFGVVGTN